MSCRSFSRTFDYYEFLLNCQTPLSSIDFRVLQVIFPFAATMDAVQAHHAVQSTHIRRHFKVVVRLGRLWYAYRSGQDDGAPVVIRSAK